MKEIIAIIIIGINLFFPFGVMLMGSNNFTTLDTQNYISNIEQPITENSEGIEGFFSTIGMYLSLLGNAISIYFKAMYFIIPNAPAFLGLIVLFFQIISGLIVYLLLRGN